MEKETDERITAIEMKLAYMEDFVNQILKQMRGATGLTVLALKACIASLLSCLRAR